MFIQVFGAEGKPGENKDDPGFGSLYIVYGREADEQPDSGRRCSSVRVDYATAVAAQKNLGGVFDCEFGMARKYGDFLKISFRRVPTYAGPLSDFELDIDGCPIMRKSRPNAGAVSGAAKIA